MLTEQERSEIEELLAEADDKRSACVEALKVVQRHSGWVSDDKVESVADLLDMSPAELDGVATFYNLIFRKPVGRHVILICDSVSCWIVGYHAVREQLEAQLGIGLGETTRDGRFTLLPTACLGACDRAPAMMVDDDLYGNVAPEQIGEILEKYR